ncbi:NADPH-dependent FMN reductase [Pseudomonas sp. OTU5201]|uniref:NADPH-dependent FMN reductase n=1 Tax=Pseudomonas sp. OTU5201 TaxID=3043850 RepID=UPI00313BEDFD
MNSKIKLVLIYGGKDEEGLSPTLVKWASEVLAQRAEFEFCVIEAADLVISPDPAEHVQRHESLRHLARADAFLIVTSEQSNGYPAELKAFIDQVPVRWHARPVAFIGYGGESGGMHAIDQLRQVLAGQHAVPICNFVSFPNPWALIDESGVMRQPDQARLPMARMLVQLNWWARALKAAREQVPYELVS